MSTGNSFDMTLFVDVKITSYAFPGYILIHSLLVIYFIHFKSTIIIIKLGMHFALLVKRYPHDRPQFMSKLVSSASHSLQIATDEPWQWQLNDVRLHVRRGCQFGWMYLSVVHYGKKWLLSVLLWHVWQVTADKRRCARLFTDFLITFLPFTLFYYLWFSRS